jgi:hypothetical protein
MDDRLRNSKLLPLLRERIREVLVSSAAFRALPPDKRTQIAHDTVRTLHFILGGDDGNSRPDAVMLTGNTGGYAPAEAVAGATPAPKVATRPPGIGEVARIGNAFADLVQEVNFPAFVSDLINGVFNSIVTSSIQQMEAYSELIENVAKTVDQFIKDNLSEQNARDHLVDKYPNHLEMDFSAEKPKLKLKEGYDEANLPGFLADLGLEKPMSSLDSENVEAQLMPAARQRIAKERQRLLATMVMMGINRLRQ